jgi:hypothetical protein
LENPHRLKVKRKRTSSQQEEEEHIPGNEIPLEDIILDVDIKNIRFPDEEERVQENTQLLVELVIQDEVFSDEETFSVHYALFDKSSKKIILERTSKDKKGKSRSTIDLRDILASKLSSIHRVTGDASDVSIIDMEAKNFMLKERVKELEVTLMPPPILATLVAMVQPGRSFQRTPKSNLRLKGASNLLTATRHFVEENIKKRMSLILNTWDLAKSLSSLGVKIQNTKEYLNADIANDEGFLKDGVSMFATKVLAMTEQTRKQEDFPSQSRIKQLKACWIQRFNILRGLLNELNDLKCKKIKAYSKLIGLDIVGTTIEVSDPKLIANSMLLTRQQFEEHVETLKRLSAKKFDNMVEYTNDDIDSWFVEYTNRNEDIETTLQKLSINFREIENELFNIKIKQEVIVAPLKEYIEEWLKRILTKITKTPIEAVNIDHITTTNKYKKGASASK